MQELQNEIAAAIKCVEDDGGDANFTAMTDLLHTSCGGFYSYGEICSACDALSDAGWVRETKRDGTFWIRLTDAGRKRFEVTA